MYCFIFWLILFYLNCWKYGLYMAFLAFSFLSFTRNRLSKLCPFEIYAAMSWESFYFSLSCLILICSYICPAIPNNNKLILKILYDLHHFIYYWFVLLSIWVLLFTLFTLLFTLFILKTSYKYEVFKINLCTMQIAA